MVERTQTPELHSVRDYGGRHRRLPIPHGPRTAAFICFPPPPAAAAAMGHGMGHWGQRVSLAFGTTGCICTRTDDRDLLTCMQRIDRSIDRLFSVFFTRHQARRECSHVDPECALSAGHAWRLA